jgi:hypothetical protein
MTAGKVLSFDLVNRQRVQALLAADWARVAAMVGKGAMADGLQVHPNTIDNALTGRTLPSFDTGLNSLKVHETALDGVMAELGFVLVSLAHTRACGFDLLAALGVLVSELANRLQDGKFCHNDRAVIAELMRELLPVGHALVAEHDARRAG